MAASRFALVSALLLGAGLTACSSSDVSADEVVDYMSYPMHLVVTFDEEGAVAGFQSVGKDGAFLEGSVRALQKP